MKNVLFGLAVLTLSFNAMPAHAGAPEVDPAKDEGKQEEQKQEEQNQEEQNQQEQGLAASLRRGARLVCYSRNLEQRVFRSLGFDAVDTQARALDQCYRRSGGLMKATCIPAGCRRF